jgi:manganese transport protein
MHALKFPHLNFRNFITFIGPALIVSTAYMDPGNYGTDLAAGGSFRYGLIWAVWLASLMAMILQYLSGKLGIASGKSLPEMVRGSLKRDSLIVPYWLAAELAAAATDLAEYLGTVIALNLLFSVPLLYAAIFGAADVLVIMVLVTKRFRILEIFFVLFVGLIGLGFLYDILVTNPDYSQILYHTFIPSLPNSNAILLVVGIIGATVMPHALFVHSWLAKGKVKIDTIEEKRKTRKLHLTENLVLLAIAAAINVAILVVCSSLYPAPNLTIQSAYYQLALKFGSVTAFIFVVTLLVSGISSSTTGTIAGQVIMEGLIGKRVGVWVRRLVTRFVNVIPTTIAILIGLNPLNLLVYSQVILSVMIPLPMIPLIYYTSNRKHMGEFVNSRATILLAIIAAAVILLFNSYLIVSLF